MSNTTAAKATKMKSKVDNDDGAVPPLPEGSSSSSSSWKYSVACALFVLSAAGTYISSSNNNNDGIFGVDSSSMVDGVSSSYHHYRRQLSMVGDTIPKYMEPLMKELRERKKLFEDTPPEEVKYWFEYTGPLQVRTEIARGDHFPQI